MTTKYTKCKDKNIIKKTICVIFAFLMSKRILQKHTNQPTE